MNENGLFVISGLLGLSFTANSPSSVPGSSEALTSPDAMASSEFSRVAGRDGLSLLLSCAGDEDMITRADRGDEVP